MPDWVQENDHSWHLPCRYDTINLRVGSDNNRAKYRLILELHPHRGVPYIHQVASDSDKEALMSFAEGWMNENDDPTELIEEHL